MPSAAVQQFLEQGERSGLFGADAARDALAPLTANPALTTDEVAARLVEKKVLTTFQAEQLLAGRGAECLIAGRYQLLDKLGEGGMGAVYQARDTKLDRVVALKVLPAGRLHDADAVARFQREAKALARLSHPHIIQAYDSGDDRGRHFLVMEYVAGVTLDQVLRRHGALPATIAADLIHQAALGLQHAHEKGLIHRDLKPANLLVAGLTVAAEKPPAVGETVAYQETPANAPSASGERKPPDEATPLSGGLRPPLAKSPPTVKILDLGLARFLQDQLGDAHLTQEGIGMGTPDYMAPEQFRDALHADARTDIYGLGCTLYHLIAGQVPFPGSSHAEKAHAHAKKEPIPLEERVPEVPAGLAFIAQKMMAKHPTERFQTAGEVAEALAPYVAGGSHSVIRLRQTGRWPPGQLTMRPPSRAKRALGWAGALAGVAVFAVLVVLAWPALFPQDVPPDGPPGPGAGPEKKPGAPPAKPRVVTIDNGLTVAQDGTGQHTTIGAALEMVKAGQTIRVLDSAVYREALAIDSLSKHTNITLEAPGRATIEPTTEGGSGVRIIGVPGVTIRGFRCRAAATKLVMILAKGPCSGLTVEDLEMDAGPGGGYHGIYLSNVELPKEARPVVVQNCVIRRASFGISILGVSEPDYTIAIPSARIVVRGNAVIDPSGYGILLRGSVRQIQVVANRVWGTTRFSALQLDHLMDSEDILIANNTVFECVPGFRLWDLTVKGKNVELRNNLFLGMVGADMLFLRMSENQQDTEGPGDVALLAKTWRLGHNWREVKRPADGGAGTAWIPPSKTDVIADPIAVLSRDPADPRFLRPAKDSPLAKAGAGGDLPDYVGAVPPEGVEPWNWQTTWDSQHPKMVFTVSKDPKNGGEFRTIREAVNAVTRPGSTVRVLDSATYAESILIIRAAHQGLTMEAVQGARITPPVELPGVPGGLPALVIQEVAGVTVRGFRLQLAKASKTRVAEACRVNGKCPGTLLDGLHCSADGLPITFGITVQEAGLSSEDPPIVVQNCTLHGFTGGIRCLGHDKNIQPGRSRNVVLRQNKVSQCELGIFISGVVQDIHILGNLIWDCGTSALEFYDLFEGTENILIANNSLNNDRWCVRFMNPIKGARNVNIRNNLVLAKTGPDLVFRSENRQVLATWRIEHNWRSARAPKDGDNKDWLAANKDKVLDSADLLSIDPQRADFLRPKAGSPPATAGAGKEDSSLPIYVGAVPPEGAEPWDWQWTWDAVVNKRLTVSQDPKAGGRFRTIGAALKAAGPKMTIRVLDAAKYAEPLVIDDAKSHEGLVLEAPRHATLVLDENSPQALLLQGVANVRVHGLRFEAVRSKFRGPSLVKIAAGCPGLILDQLECQSQARVGGIEIMNAVVPADAQPILVRNCNIAVQADGIALSGRGDAPVSRVLVVQNRIKASRGIFLELAVHDVVIAGNVVSNCDQSGLQVQDPLRAMQRILVANNTFVSNQTGVRIWRSGSEDTFAKGQVEFRGNVLMRSVAGDMLYYRQEPGKAVGTPRDSRMLLELWRFGQNYRDRAGADAPLITPLAKDDRQLDPAWLVSRVATEPDFLRPKADSPLAKAGAGGELPSYAGAIPPEGVEPWDWLKTWKARSKKTD